jgi:hypothetical protein
MIADGIYRVFYIRHNGPEVHKRLVARLLVSNGYLWHLEDHDSLEGSLPEGRIDQKVASRFASLQRSGYYQIIDEKALAEGHHPDHVEDMDVGDPQAEHRFIMTGDGLKSPAVVELWDHAVIVDGRRLDDTESHQLLSEVQAGRLVLSPVE